MWVMNTMNYVNPSTQKIERILGTGLTFGFSSLAATLSNLTPIGSPISGRGHLSGFAFDTNGYPLLRGGAGYQFFRGPGMSPSILMNASGSYWDDIAENGNYSTAIAGVYAGVHNITLASNGFFFLGAGGQFSNGLLTGNDSGSLRFFNTTNTTTKTILGRNGLKTAAPEVATPGSLLSYGTTCKYQSSGCYTQYDEDNEKFYMSENGILRVITNPRTNTNTLTTLFTAAGMQNFSLRPDKTSLFYFQSGRMKCFPLNASAPSWCDQRDLGPTPGLSSIQVVQPNNMTWEDNDTLYISTGKQILRFRIDEYEANLP